MKLKKRPKQRSMKAIERELWDLCRKLTFKKYGRNCWTCNQKSLTGANLQCGHGYPKGALGASMKYDLRILRPQCYRCNINNGGMGSLFWLRIEIEVGKEIAKALLDECFLSKGKPIKARDHYLRLICDYKFKIIGEPLL